jgi:hypothetical protein
MSNSDGQGRNVVPQSNKTPSTVTLGPLPTLNLDFLPEAERSALMTDYAKGVIDVAKKAHEFHVDVGVLKATLDQAFAYNKRGFRKRQRRYGDAHANNKNRAHRSQDGKH